MRKMQVIGAELKDTTTLRYVTCPFLTTREEPIYCNADCVYYHTKKELSGVIYSCCKEFIFGEIIRA